MGRLVFRVHALKRMFQRRIRVRDVEHVLKSGVTVEDYPQDQPYPSRLVLGWCDERPIHVVVAWNAGGNETIVVTVYEPDRAQWDERFVRRKQ